MWIFHFLKETKQLSQWEHQTSVQVAILFTLDKLLTKWKFSINEKLLREIFMKILFFFFLVFFPFLGLLPQHMEVPRLGAELELQLSAYATATATATATPDPSCFCNLHHSSQQRWILSPMGKARDRTRNLIVPSQIC